MQKPRNGKTTLYLFIFLFFVGRISAKLMPIPESLIVMETLGYFLLFMFSIVAPCCSGSTTACSFSDLGLVPTSACWKVRVVSLPGDGVFW